MTKCNVCLPKLTCLEEPHNQSQNTEDILKKIDLSGIDDWDPKIQQEAQDLICEYA